MKTRRRIVLMTTLPLLAVMPAVRAAPTTASLRVPSVRRSLPPSAAIVGPITLETALLQAAPSIRPAALEAALAAWNDLNSRGEISRSLLTVIDYSLPSTTKRMWVFDLASCRLLFHELVAHGKNSGGDLAQAFSNEMGSFMTSLGAFVTGGAYSGRNGYSLHLRGMDPGRNDRAEERAIVLHGAPYVSEAVAHDHGRLGRSFGCPAVRPAIAKTLIDVLKDHTLLYAWHTSIGEGRRLRGY